MRCPSCQFDNPEGFAFCGQCAAPLKQAPARSPNTSGEKADRRQVTVMFCDLVGSTALSERLDPEELREVMLAYREVSAKVISRFEGYIAQFLGDGLLVYFGFPLAHEDDAQRATRAALGIIEAIHHLNPQLERERGVTLAVRLGIHTGLVVAGDMVTGEQLQPNAVVGETPNIAARLQGLAEPDAVVISQATHRLVQGYFDCRSLGAHPLKGISQPVTVYEVISESTARTRLDVALATGLTPFVGRDEEMALLLECWAQAEAGGGQVVLLNGEAGIGKSRLVHRLKEQISREPGTWLTPCQCVAYYQNSALYPIIELLEQRAIGFEKEDTPEQKVRKLDGWLVQYGFSLPETVPLFASLLSLPLENRYPTLTLTTEQQKQQTFQALLTALLRRAAQQPILFVMEDLHWADASTLEFLTLLLAQVSTHRLLLLLTFRPEFTPPWAEDSYVTSLTLNRLPDHQTESMIAQVTKGKELPSEVARQLVTRTGGVPLFIEELTKMVLESGLLREQAGHYELAGALAPLAIPTTLQESLIARLDRLATVKEVLQLGATLGQSFDYELLRAVSWWDDATLQRDLSQLVDAELLYQSGVPPEARYTFKHALIQESAYQQLLKSRRQQYHQRIAEVLEQAFAATTETQPELLAHHYTQAGLLEQAIPHWWRAGQRAINRSANVEAISHLMTALDLLQRLAETPERMQQELEMQLALGPPLQAIKGYTAPETERAYNRALELCQKLGDTQQLFKIVWGRWYFYGVRPDMSKAVPLAEQLLTLAESAQDSALLLVAHRTLGAIVLTHGELRRALENLKQGLALYSPEAHRPLAYVYGQDIGVICKQWSGMVLWLLGYPTQAAEAYCEAIEMAHETAHPVTIAYVLALAAHYYQMVGDRAQAEALAEQGVKLSNEYGIIAFSVLAGMVGGTLAEGDAIPEGIALARANITAWQSVGANLFLPYHLTMVAEAHRKIGQIEEGLATVAEGLALSEWGGEYAWDADLYRVKGDLLLQQGAAGAAEAAFRTAIQVAQGQEAKSYELRAALHLGRLLKTQGRTEEANRLLSGVYGWFTEGFDTPDLKAARALLAELRG